MSDGPSSSDRAVEAGRGALFIGFAKVFFAAMGTVWNLLLTRLVGAADVGRFSVVNNLMSTINNTIVQGTVQSVAKFTAEDDTRIDPVKRAGLVMQSFVGVAAGLVFVIGAPWLADFANAPGYVGWFRLAGGVPFLYSFYAVFVGSANGQRRFRLQASFDVTFSILKTVLLLGGAVIGRSTGHAVTGAFLGFIAAAAVILVVAAARLGLPHGQTRFPASRLMAFMAGALLYTFLLNVALNVCDSYLLRRFAGAVVEATRADAIVGHYQGLRNLGLLPYQVLLVITFVIFPLISRSTFVEDRDSTRLYISQTLRYAIMIGAALAVVLSARPEAVLSIIYPHAGYLEGAQALPVLVWGVTALAVLSVSGSIINASGRPRWSVAIMLVAVAISASAAFVLVPRAQPGAAMMMAQATAVALGDVVGLVLALAYLWRTFGAGPPLASVLRIAGAVAIATVAGRVFVGRVFPSGGKLMGLVTLAVVGLVYVAALIILRELGPADAAKLQKILRRKK